MLTVKQLIDALAGLPPTMPVIIQRDSEGNGFSPLSEVTRDCVYTAETAWRGEVFDCAWTPADACMTEAEHAAMLTKPRCVVLAPTY